MLFDSHAHYDDSKFENDRYEVIEKAHKEGVSYILNASTDLVSAKECVALSDYFDYVYTAAGFHPHNVNEIEKGHYSQMKQLLYNDKVVAIGEIGLDYYYDFAPRELQKKWFSKQLNLAKEYKKPIIVHDREAHRDTMDILWSEKAKEIGGVFHSYSGSIEMAREILNNNFYISIAGQITFKNARKLIDIVDFIPLDRLLIETDSPYLTPVPNRGKRNNSSYIRYTAERIAEIKNLNFTEIAEITAHNAKKLFNID